MRSELGIAVGSVPVLELYSTAEYPDSTAKSVRLNLYGLVLQPLNRYFEVRV